MDIEGDRKRRDAINKVAPSMVIKIKVTNLRKTQAW